MGDPVKLFAASMAAVLALATTCVPAEKPTKRPSVGCKAYLVTDVQFHGSPQFTADVFFNSPTCKDTLYVTITQEEWNASTCWTNGDHYWDKCLKGD